MKNSQAEIVILSTALAGLTLLTWLSYRHVQGQDGHWRLPSLKKLAQPIRESDKPGQQQTEQLAPLRHSMGEPAFTVKTDENSRPETPPRQFKP